MRKLSHAALKKKLLKEPAVQVEYDRLAQEYALIDEMLCARKRAGLTQKNIAEAMRTTTSVVSRLESLPGGAKSQHSPSIKTLSSYAAAVGCTLQIKLIPGRANGS